MFMFFKYRKSFKTTEIACAAGWTKNNDDDNSKTEQRQGEQTNPVGNWHDPIKLRARERVLLKGLKCNINAFVILALI